jgi:hypothetical protein
LKGTTLPVGLSSCFQQKKTKKTNPSTLFAFLLHDGVQSIEHALLNLHAVKVFHRQLRSVPLSTVAISEKIPGEGSGSSHPAKTRSIEELADNKDSGPSQPKLPIMLPLIA